MWMSDCSVMWAPSLKDMFYYISLGLKVVRAWELVFLPIIFLDDLLQTKHNPHPPKSNLPHPLVKTGVQRTSEGGSDFLFAIL